MTTTEKSKLETDVEKMSAEHFGGLKAVVDAEHTRRAGEADRAHLMSDYEFNRWRQDEIAKGEASRRRADEEWNRRQRERRNG